MNKLGFVKREMVLSVGSRELTVTLASPADNPLAEDPILLLAFVHDRNSVFDNERHFAAIRPFLESGHRVLSFDIPNHGERVNAYGSDIRGMCRAFLHGEDPFRLFLEDASVVIEHCLTSGIAKAGRIAVSGSSRSGYLALRLLAAERRVAAGAFYHPVTDWRELTEFQEVRTRKEVIGLDISRYIEGMSGKYMYIAIPNHDTRVSTRSCCEFYLQLLEENSRTGRSTDLIDFCCTPDSGHALGQTWFELGGRSLLKAMSTS